METTADLPECPFITHRWLSFPPVLLTRYCVTPLLVVLFCHCSVTALSLSLLCDQECGVRVCV